MKLIFCFFGGMLLTSSLICQIEYEFPINGQYRTAYEEYSNGEVYVYDILGNDTITDYLIYFIHELPSKKEGDVKKFSLNKEPISIIADLGVEYKILNCVTKSYSFLNGIDCDLEIKTASEVYGRLFSTLFEGEKVSVLFLYPLIDPIIKNNLNLEFDQLLNGLRFSKKKN